MSSIQATIDIYAKGHEDAFNGQDVSAVSTALDPACMRYVAPATFFREMSAVTGMAGGISIEEYHKQLAPQLTITESVQTDIYETVLDVPNRKAALHMAYRIKLKGADDETVLERTVFLYFNEDGSKITKVLEFLDPSEIKTWIAKVQKAGSWVAQEASK